MPTVSTAQADVFVYTGARELWVKLHQKNLSDAKEFYQTRRTSGLHIRAMHFLPFSNFNRFCVAGFSCSTIT